MNLSGVILKPVLTEKAVAQQKEGIWSFIVHPQATKTTVKKALQEIFAVHSKKVRIINIKPKRRHLRRERKSVLTARAKKALVWLPAEEKIKEMGGQESK